MSQTLGRQLSGHLLIAKVSSVSGSISKSDQTFLRQFSTVIAGLVALIIVLALFALYLYGLQPTYSDPAQVQAADARLTPVGAVYAGATGQAAMAAAAAAAAKAAASQVAYGGTLDGKTIFGQLCTSCHTAGVAGAPILGNKTMWGPRIAQGLTTLFKHAEDGYHGPDGNFMPPRGGNPSLTNAQIEATVKWMVSQVK